MILRPYQKEDDISILSLFSKCFEQNLPENFWRWRFFENPIKTVFIHLACDDNELAAHYAVSPILISVDGRDYKTGLSMTTMTHPKYRGRKLFPALAERIYELLKEHNYLAVLGFPNIRSHRIFVRDLNWVDIYEIPTMQFKIDHSRKKYTFDNTTDNLFELDYEGDKFSKNFIHVKKNTKYLRWRYANNPVNDYENIVVSNDQHISSFCVVKKFHSELDIVDLQAVSFEEAEYLITQSIAFAYLNGLDRVNCWAPIHHFAHPLYEKYGFVNKEPITYLGFRQLYQCKNVKVSTNYSDWFVQMGDSDVY